MAKILNFIQQKCCMCDKNSTNKIKLTDVDACSEAGFKYFCDQHKVKENVKEIKTSC